MIDVVATTSTLTGETDETDEKEAAMAGWHVNGVALTEEQQLIYESIKGYAEANIKPGAATRDREHAFPHELMPGLAELGLFGMKVSVDDGGAGADHVGYGLAMAALAESDASVCVTMAVSNLIADILSKFGNPEQKKKHLAPFIEGKLTAGAFCLSEPEAGSDPAAMRTTAIKDGEHYVLNGAKQWITNGDFSGLYLVFAKTAPDAPRGKGISCFLVEKGTEGLQPGRPEQKMGLRSSNTVPLAFEDCRVPAENLIGEEGQGYAIALSILDGGRIGIAGQSIGIAEAALDEGIRYARDRPAFGKSVADFQNSQFAIADSRADLDQAWMFMIRAAQIRDELGKSPKASSMAKLWASEACGRIVDRMLQLHGGYGYTEDYAIERLYRDARVTRIYEGSSEIQRIVIARELLRD